jgi:ribonuclease HII
MGEAGRIAGIVEDTAWRRICGVDEVGRGPLAGPVVAAAVVLPRGFDTTGIADSKTLDPDTRAAVADRVFRDAIVSVASASAVTIDRLNIRRATLWAMRRAVAGLPVPVDCVLFDGVDVPSGIGCLCLSAARADGFSHSVGAASIVAKVVRDDLMIRLGERLPAYGFERHKGYATPEHREALARHGPSVHHRRSFAPVRALLEGAIP